MTDDKPYPEMSREDSWMDTQRPQEYTEKSCLRINPTNKEINQRFYAVLPFFKKDLSNSAFLNKFRATVREFLEGDSLDQETAEYTAVLTPLVLLQSYRDAWCLLERFHRALRLYQMSHPTEKRASLKLLKKFRAVDKKVRIFVSHLPGSAANQSTTPAFALPEPDDEPIHDKEDFRFFKELAKNFDG
ncbi:uncharacterized protein LOC112050761 [Bicyclus anynana]|uniref:Uncharacterized protein LOC112050761 n=1 Tax=Bicyclus anynana TaxID=110368 RepID=A0A6J1NIV5_BICAN|nr:uncharacterized protein LOC112050761 [Bicyclus anynana]